MCDQAVSLSCQLLAVRLQLLLLHAALWMTVCMLGSTAGSEGQVGKDFLTESHSMAAESCSRGSPRLEDYTVREAKR